MRHAQILCVCWLFAGCGNDIQPGSDDMTAAVDGGGGDLAKPAMPDLTPGMCGLPGNPCCAFDTCSGGGCCVGGVCTGAGAMCPNNLGACMNGSCGTCGRAGQPCCGGH